ncbi:hypothetical protein ACFX2B_000324 [Malus domestica]
MGYYYMWCRDWSFSDVMYVTRHNMANVVEALIKEVASKSNDFVGNGTTNTLKMSECAMGTYLDLVCSLSHLESNFGGALVIDLHDLSVYKVVDMATRFESALLLMIGKSILSSSNKTQEENVDVVLGTGNLSLLVENTSVEQLGFVRKVTIFKDSTSIIGDAASKDRLQVHGVSPFDIMGRILF